MLVTFHREKPWLVAVIALLGSLALAVGGALLTGPQLGTVTGSVEALSAESGNFLARASQLFPLGFAFSAGMVSSVNPCGFVMLPAYLGLYLGDRSPSAATQGFATRFQRAVLIGCTVTAGFVLMFAVIGAPIGFGARGIIGVFPWIGLAVGVVLAVAGAYLLAGGKLYSNIGSRLSALVPTPATGGIRAYFTFGLAYGIASLSCTLPVFLAVVVGAFAAGSFWNALSHFLLYGFGMGTVILTLTVAMAIFRSAGAGAVRRLLPYMHTAAAVLLLASGAFIVYYWLTLGELVEEIRALL